MRKLLPCLVLLATVLTFCRASMAIELPLATDSSRAGNTLVLVGGMGGGTGGGMGGMAGGGMGGMAGGGMGGMTGGGMGGMAGGGIGGMTGGGMGGEMGGFGAPPGNSPSGLYGGGDGTGAGVQPAQYYLCVTPYDRCSLASSPGSLRSGSSCTCSTGHRGNIK